MTDDEADVLINAYGRAVVDVASGAERRFDSDRMAILSERRAAARDALKSALTAAASPRPTAIPEQSNG